MKVFLVPFLVLFVSSSLAQTDTLARQTPPPAVIDTVIIAGNEKTKDYVILNEMTLKPGSLVTPEAIEFDRNRIYSLGLFTRVDIFFDVLEGQRFLYVEVRERWYLIPLPLFGFRDGDPKKLFFGAGLLHNNVGGRNQKLFAAAVFGYNPSASLFFSDPLIDREHDLYFSGNLSYSRVRNQSVAASSLTGDFDELHYDISASLGKRLNLYETAGLTLGFQRVQIDTYYPGRTVSPSGHDGFIYASAVYTYDSRDLREYASRGRLISLFITKSGFGETELSFTRFGADLRRYTPLPLNLVLAARAFGMGVSGGPLPTYARSYFGYGERIRGYYNTVFEGENILGTTLELRYPLLEARTITVTALPLPPEFSVWRFGMSGALFGDAGVVWFRGDKVQLRSFASGYGAGLIFLLPYSYVVRLEYAFNEYGRGQFIFNLRGAI